MKTRLEVNFGGYNSKTKRFNGTSVRNNGQNCNFGRGEFHLSFSIEAILSQL